MNQAPVVKQSQLVEPFTAESTSINPLDALRIVRSAGKAILAQAALHGQLARVEWAQEKDRLAKMLVIALLGFAAVLCVMLFTGADLVRVKAKLSARVAAAKESIEEMSAQVAQRARKAATVTNNYVHEQPWQAVGIGAAAGVLLGFVLGRRK